MLFCKEDSVAGYLGVHIDHRKDSIIRLTQKGFAHRIVKAMHLIDSNVDPVDTPCTKYLPIDKFRPSTHGEFSYPSVAGQLNYLQGHSRSDITMATSQTAQYVHNLKCSHELALIQIGHYLKGKLDKGLIFKPIDAEFLQTSIYVDAAFACRWGTELSTNPDSVKSRTGCIIEIANYPVV